MVWHEKKKKKTIPRVTATQQQIVMGSKKKERKKWLEQWVKRTKSHTNCHPLNCHGQYGDCDFVLAVVVVVNVMMKSCPSRVFYGLLLATLV